jgi:hypothetical protein
VSNFFYSELHVSIFFSIAHVSFVTKAWRERPTYIAEHLFVEWMDGTMLTSHRRIAGGIWCAHES